MRLRSNFNPFYSQLADTKIPSVQFPCSNVPSTSQESQEGGVLSDSPHSGRHVVEPISVRTIQEMYASPLQLSNLLASDLWSLFNKVVEHPSISETDEVTRCSRRSRGPFLPISQHKSGEGKEIAIMRNSLSNHEPSSQLEDRFFF